MIDIVSIFVLVARKRIRIGLITNNYGRAVNTLAGAHFMTSQIELRNHPLLDSTYWIFPSQNTYPFINISLRRYLKIVPPFLIMAYRILSRFRLTSRLFISSQDEFNSFAECMYTSEAPKFSSSSELDLFPELASKLSEKNISLEDAILVHMRDSSWDMYLRHSKDYVKSQSFRNSNVDIFLKVIQLLVEGGVSVIRTGRSQTELPIAQEARYFDYSVWPNATDEIDFFLWSKCKGAIVSLNGGCQPGFFFKRPMLILDYKEPIETILSSFPNYPDGMLFVALDLESRVSGARDIFFNLHLPCLVSDFLAFNFVVPPEQRWVKVENTWKWRALPG